MFIDRYSNRSEEKNVRKISKDLYLKSIELNLTRALNTRKGDAPADLAYGFDFNVNCSLGYYIYSEIIDEIRRTVFHCDKRIGRFELVFDKFDAFYNEEYSGLLTTVLNNTELNAAVKIVRNLSCRLTVSLSLVSLD